MRPTRLAALISIAAAAVVPWAGAGEWVPGIDFVDPRVLELDPLDTRRRPGETVVLSGKLLGEHVAPEVVVVRPDGRAYELDPVHVRWAKPVVRAEIALKDGPGVYRVEVTGLIPPDVTHSGTRLRIFAGVSPDRPDAPVPPDEKVEPESLPWTMLEARFFDLVNAERKRLKLEPFEWLEPLSAAARDLAKSAVKVGRLDHIVDVDGTVARRLSSMYGWKGLIYRRPPGAPSPAPYETSYVCAATDQGWALEPILYRWSRFPAFCLPMTSERMTHAGCGVARRKDGFLYIVFVYAQLNDTTMVADAEKRYRALLSFWKAGDAKTDPDHLRELGRWRRPEALAEARRAESSPVIGIRGAAWDVALLVDEQGARRRLLKHLSTLKAAAASPRRADEARSIADWMAHVHNAPDLVEEVWRVTEGLYPPARPGAPEQPK
jgi:hypothetical protein